MKNLIANFHLRRMPGDYRYLDRLGKLIFAGACLLTAAQILIDSL